MKKRKLAIRYMAMSLAAASVTTSVFPMVQAQAEEAEFVNGRAGTLITNNGVAELGRGTASITIHPNNVSQSLVGKTFRVYKLFDAENSVDLESINYTFHHDCKSALQTVIGNALGKEASSVTEYEVIDYIQSLNNFKVEGAQEEQKENGY